MLYLELCMYSIRWRIWQMTARCLDVMISCVLTRFTYRSSVSVETFASVAVDLVDAGRIVQARVTVTFVYIWKSINPCHVILYTLISIV